MTARLQPDQRAVLQAALTDRQQQLHAQQAQHQGAGSRAEHAHELLLQDSNDASQHDAEHLLDFVVADRETVELAAVADALRRLAAGSYGRCADCGADVPFERLRLEPWARRCVACESAFEAARQRGQPHAASL
jgi:DnaK suppressor protein